MARFGRLFWVGVCLVTALVVVERPAAATVVRHVLYAGQQIVAGTPNDSLTVGDEGFELTVSSYYLELEEFGPIGTTVWATDDEAKPHPWNDDRTVLRMQRNGNLVLWTSRHVKMWQSGTRGTNLRFTLRRSGNMVIQNPRGHVVWATYTTAVMMPEGATLNAGSSRTNRFGYWFHPPAYSRLTMQPDGNLVHRCHGHVDWQTHTHIPGSQLLLQYNGNLVVRSPRGRTLWSTHTRVGSGRTAVLDTRTMLLQTTSFRRLWQAHFGTANDACA